MTDRPFVSTDPSTGQFLARYEPHSAERVNADLDRAAAAFPAWRDAGLAARARVLRSVADGLGRDRERLAGLASAEMGKPLPEARAEVDKCAWACRHFADHAAGYLADTAMPSDGAESYVSFHPLGTVLAVMPWNFPYWQVFRFAAPTLAAGNVGVLKHAENVTGCALEVERLFDEAGAPPGVFTTSLLPVSRVAEVIADDRVAAVTLTGSASAGRAVAAAAGGGLKKSVLELGGSDAFIVLADADLEAAVRTATASRFQNCGQSCIAAKRFIVVADVAERFTAGLVAAAGSLLVGHPLADGVRLGPLAREDLRDVLHAQVLEAVAAGAELRLGGELPTGSGWFYPPTVLTAVTPDMRVATEEVFGPVAPILVVADADEAVAVANASPYGLGGNVWTGDVASGRALARRLLSGSVFVNGMTASDPRLPFGGIKQSGYGRELSVFGIREFVNVQTVWVGPERGPAPAATTGPEPVATTRRATSPASDHAPAPASGRGVE